jgi:MoaA/NifB/PqqE/SkfB family radical SAM enzyme
MKKEKVFRILDEIAQKRPWLGPIYPVKLHQMGEPFLHPDLVEIVAHAEKQGVGIELNTNCGLITREKADGLYAAGLTNLILS